MNNAVPFLWKRIYSSLTDRDLLLVVKDDQTTESESSNSKTNAKDEEKR